MMFLYIGLIVVVILTLVFLIEYIYSTESSELRPLVGSITPDQPVEIPFRKDELTRVADGFTVLSKRPVLNRQRRKYINRTAGILRSLNRGKCDSESFFVIVKYSDVVHIINTIYLIADYRYLTCFDDPTEVSGLYSRLLSHIEGIEHALTVVE